MRFVGGRASDQHAERSVICLAKGAEMHSNSRSDSQEWWSDIVISQQLRF